MSYRPPGTSNVAALILAFVACTTLGACESNVASIAAPVTVDAGAVRERASASAQTSAAELDKIRASAAAASPDLGRSEVGQKSGVNE